MYAKIVGIIIALPFIIWGICAILANIGYEKPEEKFPDDNNETKF